MGKIAIDQRDQIITAFRGRVCETLGITPFTHQAEWWLATDGLILTDQYLAPEEGGFSVQLPDQSITSFKTLPRPFGRARVIADLGAFKVGKSFGGAIWATGFAAIPDARVSLIGLEYDICSPEFEVLVEALLSEKGMNLKAESVQNRPRDGRMWLDLANGARFEAKSWERKDTLKGKEIDCYLFCEAFMLPGIECYTGISQNLRARKGYSLFATTPDRPWVQILHDNGHGHPSYPDWHCTCGVNSEVNPFTFDRDAMMRDDPEGGGLMTREKFAIAYQGKLGDYVGRVYNFQKGDPSYRFTPTTHPMLWKDPEGPAELRNLSIPEGWEVMGAIDTGTYMSGAFVAFDPDGDAFILYEQPNYNYVGLEAELDPTSSIPSWADSLKLAMEAFGVRAVLADKNTQFKHELQNAHGVYVLPANVNLQTRTEISREYFQSHKVFLAPWLRVLPAELENAQWPEESTKAGKFERIKMNDHTLDPIEHILAKRPRGRIPLPQAEMTWAESVGLRKKNRFVNIASLGV